MGAFLELLEATANAASWAHNHWLINLQNTLSGQGLLAISSLSAIEQNDYITIKATLLATYHGSKETYERKCSVQYSVLETLTHGSEMTSI